MLMAFFALDFGAKTAKRIKKNIYLFTMLYFLIAFLLIIKLPRESASLA